MGRVAAAFAEQPTWRDGLRAVAYELRAFLREDPDRAREMVIEAPYGSERAREVRELGIAGLTELIDLGRAEMPDPEALPRSLAEVTAGAIFNRLHLVVAQGPESLAGEEPSAEIVRELMFSAVLPYRGLDAALEELEIPPPAPPPRSPKRGPERGT